MKFDFVPVDYDYFDFEGRNFVQLIGRNEKGEKVCVVDSYEPNFWVILKDKKSERKVLDKLKGLEVEKAGRNTKVVRAVAKDKKFLGRDVRAIQVYVTNHKDAHDIASELGEMEEIEARREYDLSLATKYIKEKKVEPLNWYTVECDVIGAGEFGGISQGLEVKNCYFAKKISKISRENFEPKILAYDIETDDSELGKGDVLMISLFGEGLKKVLTWKKCDKSQDYVECLKDEGEMIERFVELIKEYEPDILAGYFSDGFDLPYIKAAAAKNKVKLSLGVDGKGPVFTRGRIPTGRICGIVHVDIYRFIDAVFSQYLQSETLSLNEVAGELVGEKKEEFDFKKLASMKEGDWREMFSYNLQDSVLTYKLAMKLWPDLLEFTRIIKEPLFEVTRDRMASHVENYIIHNIDRFDEIVERRPVYDEIAERRMREKYEGAFVLEPNPGLYENVVMFDFTSFWPSIIVSYNLSKSTYSEKKVKDSIEVEVGKKKEYFLKEPGFFPQMLAEIIELRKKYKKEYNADKSGLLKAKSNAYKLLANASYGYQGFFGARYYCPEASAATTAISRDFIKETMKKIEGAGHKVLYSDTDSIAFLQNEKSQKEILDFLKELNESLPGIMELDLEDFYLRGLFVSKRTVEAGAKKKYALMDHKGNLKIRGFETVRRDWCRLARDLQSDILKKILSDGNEKKALEKLRKILKDLKERKIDLEDLMIRTQLRQPLSEYKAEGPHVVAARKMQDQEIPISVGMLIEYFIGETNGKGKRVGDRVFLPDEKAKYDMEYYLNNQILPAVGNIFDVFGIDVKEIAEGETQKKLF